MAACQNESFDTAGAFLHFRTTLRGGCLIRRQGVSVNGLYGQGIIIAEKPSVAGDIAKALGGFKKQDDHFESDQYRALVGGRPSA